VLSKKAAEPAAPAPASPSSQSKKPQGPQELTKVKLEDQVAAGSGSSLSAFDASDPFAPPQKVLKAARQQAQGTNVTTPTGTGTGTGTAPTDTGTGGGTPNTGTGGGTPNPGGGTKTTEFTYVLDVTFWNNGHRRKVEGMQKLDMLPNQAAPLLIFMGVSDNAGNAVFLVDSTLSATGEGKCKPSPTDCAFLYVGAGSEEEFTNANGDSYRLIVNEIRKVKVGDTSGKAASDKKGKSSKSARAAVGTQAPTRRFVFPALTDLVVQSGDGSDNSTGAAERR
jgi:hypothetical protein